MKAVEGRPAGIPAKGEERPAIGHFFPEHGKASLCGVPYESVPDVVPGDVELCVVCRELLR